VNTSSASHYSVRCDEANQDLDSEFVEEYRHVFNKCITLIRACRQIYHEAVGILYGFNSFRFLQIRMPGRQDQVRSLEYAAKMLYSIRSYFKLLSKVLINLLVYHHFLD
jgi:hypothetical protein